MNPARQQTVDLDADALADLFDADEPPTSSAPPPDLMGCECRIPGVDEATLTGSIDGPLTWTQWAYWLGVAVGMALRSIDPPGCLSGVLEAVFELGISDGDSCEWVDDLAFASAMLARVRPDLDRLIDQQAQRDAAQEKDRAEHARRWQQRMATIPPGGKRESWCREARPARDDLTLPELWLHFAI